MDILTFWDRYIFIKGAGAWLNRHNIWTEKIKIFWRGYIPFSFSFEKAIFRDEKTFCFFRNVKSAFVG